MRPTRIISLNGTYRRILVIGDIHGCAHHLEKLLAAVQPTQDDLIITLGDYIDRGPGSKGVLDTLVRLHHASEINIVSLRGNHDALMLMCLSAIFPKWRTVNAPSARNGPGCWPRC